MPTYPEVRLALASWGAVARRIEATRPDHIHIATEGPIGFAARHYCKANKRVFTTSYHTRFPEYVAQRVPIPERWTYAALRRFHAPAAVVMVPTPTIRDELTQRGFARVKVWSRGVDHLTFRPRDTERSRFSATDLSLCRPRRGRKESRRVPEPETAGIEGDRRRRARTRLARTKISACPFPRQPFGEALAQTYASADVFVFPSRTDTFGIVLIEALASGVPVAAYPVAGPLDVIGTSDAGVLSEDLGAACLAALQIPRAAARQHSLQFTWSESARQFLDNVVQGREQHIVPARELEPLA